MQNRLRADISDLRSLSAVDIQGRQRGGFCIVPTHLIIMCSTASCVRKDTRFCYSLANYFFITPSSENVDFVFSLKAFSPNLKYLVSIGDQHDMLVNIWNWRVCSLLVPLYAFFTWHSKAPSSKLTIYGHLAVCWSFLST